MSDNISPRKQHQLAEKLLANVEETFGSLTADQANSIYDLVCDILKGQYVLFNEPKPLNIIRQILMIKTRTVLIIKTFTNNSLHIQV